MNDTLSICCICSAEADWVRMRMPNGQQMHYLCDRHHQALEERNPLLAGYYDALSASMPIRKQHSPFTRTESVQDAGDDHAIQDSDLDIVRRSQLS